MLPWLVLTNLHLCRIRAAVPTLKYLLDNGAKVLLTSHLVRVGCSCFEHNRDIDLKQLTFGNRHNEATASIGYV